MTELISKSVLMRKELTSKYDIDEVITMSDLPKYWTELCDTYTYMEYVIMYSLFQRNYNKKISLDAFQYPKKVMLNGSFDAQRKLLIKMLQDYSEQPLGLEVLTRYLIRLTEMFIGISKNLQEFWTKYTTPTEAYKIENFVKHCLEEFNRFQELNLRKSKHFNHWMKKNDMLSEMHRAVFTHLYTSQPCHLYARHSPYRTTSCILDLMDIIWLNHHSGKPLDQKWDLLYRANMIEDSLKTLAVCIEKKDNTVVVIEDTNGNVFGAFTTSLWLDSRIYQGSGDCFLFRLDPGYQILKCIQGEHRKGYLYLNTSSVNPGLGFGGPLGQCGLWLDNMFGRGYCSPKCKDFQYGLLIEEEIFVAEKIQVWCLPDNEDEASQSPC